MTTTAKNMEKTIEEAATEVNPSFDRVKVRMYAREQVGILSEHA